MTCKVTRKLTDGTIYVYTKKINSDMRSHLRAHGKYLGLGNWEYTSGERTLLFAIGHYIGLGKQAWVKAKLKDIEAI